MSKIITLAVGAAGYVLGTKAGRERYEQIKDQAAKLRSNPKVRKAAADAQDVVAQKAPVVKEKVANATGQGGSKNDGGSNGSGSGSAQRPAGQPGATGGPTGA